jgi:SCP-2 sterol transfer family
VARLIAGASGEQLGRVDRGIARRIVLAALPVVLQLRYDRRDAHELAGELELRIPRTEGYGHDPITIVIDHGRCSIRPGASAEPTATMTSTLADLVRSGTGAVDLPVLIAQQRVELCGDPWFAMRSALFRLATRSWV